MWKLEFRKIGFLKIRFLKIRFWKLKFRKLNLEIGVLKLIWKQFGIFEKLIENGDFEN